MLRRAATMSSSKSSAKTRAAAPSSLLASPSPGLFRGREFLLAHRLFRSHRTGRVIKPEFLRLSFPPRWHYDILRALDYFRSMDVASDSHMAEAIALVESRQATDGRWALNNAWPGRIFFELEEVGKPSRWNTLRALRVLRWWRGGKPTGSITIPAPI